MQAQDPAHQVSGAAAAGEDEQQRYRPRRTITKLLIYIHVYYIE